MLQRMEMEMAMEMYTILILFLSILDGIIIGGGGI